MCHIVRCGVLFGRVRTKGFVYMTWIGTALYPVSSQVLSTVYPRHSNAADCELAKMILEIR
jgi:hypothetical protein